jgi:hypothetical protein
MTERIHNFTGNLIAFHRPIKKTYYFFTWNTTAREWGAYDGNHENISLHKSRTHTLNGAVDINVRLGRRRHIISIVSDKCFLKSGNIHIPILKVAGIAIQGIQKLKQYTVTVEHDTATYLMNARLWLTPPAAPSPSPAAPASAAAAAASSASVAQVHQKKGIPRRIAWLIAEDACKRGEVCPIVQEELSPLTSSVTSCFHVFNTEAIASWAARQEGRDLPCPVCREPCETTVAYEESSE